MAPPFSEAVAFAATLHHDQRRKTGGGPYLSHLLGVASLVMEAHGSEEQCIAALLHDAVEDQGGFATAKTIRLRFGDRVAKIVLECTDNLDPTLSWRQRKTAAVDSAAIVSPESRLVLAADKIHNCRSLTAALRTEGSGVWKAFSGGRTGTLWYYRAMAEALAKAGGSALQPELEATVDELEAVASDVGFS